MAEVVILGAGLAGISAAYHFEQQGFFDYLLFEKGISLGGLCGSIEQDGFTFDYTGHLLHINDPYFHDLIARVVGFEQLHTIHRRSFIYSYDRYTPYPYQTNLRGLPLDVIADCVAGYVTRHTHINKVRTFPEWVLKHFGSGFAKHFFFPYQRKIFAYDLDKITATWTGRFVPATSLEIIIAGIMQPAQESVGYNAQFFYPKTGGIVSWVKGLAHELVQPIAYQAQAIAVDIKHKEVIFADGHHEPYKQLISTLPLNQLLEMVIGVSHGSFMHAAGKLLCNSVLNINMGMRDPDLSDKHWIYFPSNAYPWYRIGFPHNFSPAVVPHGCSSLYAEIAYIGALPATKNYMIKKSIDDIKKLLHIPDDHVITEKILDISHAYVIYDHWREKNLPKLLQVLKQEQIYSIGRYGAWKYCSMQETVLDARDTIHNILATMYAHAVNTKGLGPKEIGI